MDNNHGILDDYNESDSNDDSDDADVEIVICNTKHHNPE